MGLLQINGVLLSALSSVLPAGNLPFAGGSGSHDDPAATPARVPGSAPETQRTALEDLCASDLCAQAAQTLFAVCATKARDIDGLLFVSRSPDYLLPATASMLQHALGLPTDCAALDMNSGSTGFVHALWLGASLVASGACSRMLLLVGDTPGRFLPSSNAADAPEFGAAGTAALLERNAGAAPMSFLLGTDGSAYESLIIPGGGSRIPHQADEGPESAFNRTVTDKNGVRWTLGEYGQLWKDDSAVFAFGTTVIPRHIRLHLTQTGLEPEDLDWLFLHQADRRLAEAIARNITLDAEKSPWLSPGKYGNLGAASLPVQACDVLPPGTARDNASRTLFCGFGSGLSWASCVCSLDNTVILPTQQFMPQSDRPSRDSYIAFWHEKFRGKKSG